MSSSSKQAVFGILFSDDKKKILLIQRRDIPVWVLPGGGVETGETAEEAVIREMLEETGLTVSIERQVAEYSPVNKLTQLTKVFECKHIAGLQQKGPETRDIQFFDVQNLPKLIPPTFPKWIGDALSNEPSIIKKSVEGASLLVVLKSVLFHPIISIRYFLTKIGIHINSKD
jgi:8-oxo-dGTP pyrophosphatase MutT (NUDIX family)